MIPIVIPAFNPDERLETLVSELHSRGHLIVVVNDGSTVGKRIFDSIADKCVLLVHGKNVGKGAAIKTAISYISERYRDSEGCVFADADGQHLVSDIELVSDQLQNNKTHLVLGARSVTTENPFRSWLGRVLMQLAFWVAIRRWLTDTQTGLRGVPNLMYNSILKMRGTRYELESEMIVSAHVANVTIDEINVSTVYWGNNNTSHFRTYIDFARIIFTVFWSLLPVRYLTTSVASFCLDNTVFASSFFLLSLSIMDDVKTVIAISVCIARVISGHFHYVVNALLVFKQSLSKQNYIKYVSLVSCIGFLSFESTSVGTMYFGFRDWQVVAWKVFVEVLLLLVSYLIQRFIVFKQ